MWVEFQRISIPFLIAAGNVLTASLALGLLPALWLLLRGRRWGNFLIWGLVAAICITAAVYALPLAMHEWKTKADKSNTFRLTAVVVGYVVTLLFAPMIIPEPLRIARRRLRKERTPEKTRKRRRKRRSQQLPGEMKIR